MVWLLSIPFWSDFIALLWSVRTTLVLFFQSHFGLILSCWILNIHHLLLLSFNPILVWFYPNVPPNRLNSLIALSIPFWSDFIAVWILCNSRFHLAFNPILVWFYRERSLKHSTHCGFLSIPFWSDFILSEYLVALVKKHQLSIPFWSDFIRRKRKIHQRYPSREWLSIPFWSDFIRATSTSFKLDWDSLSIPFWSDFIIQ